MYKMLPLRTLSRVWGWVNSLELPTAIRTPILKSYAHTFGCNLAEADTEDLQQYKNLREFFRRSLQPGTRPLHGDDNAIVSPSDATILHMISASDVVIEQIKVRSYTIASLLGPNTWTNKESSAEPNLEYQKSLLHHSLRSKPSAPPTHQYYSVIYLAPGDY